MEKRLAPHLVIVFPADKSKAALGPMFSRLVELLADACGEAPCNVMPDVTAVCLLVSGDRDRIVRALEGAITLGTSYLVLPLESGFEARGLSTAVSWLRRHHPS